MIHNFKYSFKILFSKKSLIFWTFIFPILLGTFFNMAFSNIEKNEKFEPLNIAIINNKDYSNNKIYKETFDELGNSKSKNQIFNIKYTNKDNAKKMLKNNKIVGYVIINKDKFNITVSNNGTNETILKSVIDEISNTTKVITNSANIKINNSLKNGNKLDYNQIYKSVIDDVNNTKANIKDITGNNLSYTMIEFYTLIAMACLYGGMLGMTAINQNLANMSSNGKRVSICPIKKIKLIISSLLSSYFVSLIGIFILLFYTIFVLKVDYGNNIFSIILLILLGCLAGVTMGMAVASISKVNENSKTGIILSVTMLCCFLSGMMGITMKYIIDKNIPIINIINPASMITDGFYSLYYYDTLNRYYFNIISLIIFSALMIIISFISLRRQKYDSI